ncbi:PP230 [Orf virus]|uniref:PP230 n=1 Tax=Orf virus TaxID=10258 RepID=F1AXA8_ORFV|nr:PP230 [Orf virus]
MASAISLLLTLESSELPETSSSSPDIVMSGEPPTVTRRSSRLQGMDMRMPSLERQPSSIMLCRLRLKAVFSGMNPSTPMSSSTVLAEKMPLTLMRSRMPMSREHSTTDWSAVSAASLAPP